MNDDLLVALARDANGVSVPIERVSPLSTAISRINRSVAEAAEARVGIDRRAETFETFRAQHMPSGTVKTK